MTSTPDPHPQHPAGEQATEGRGIPLSARAWRPARTLADVGALTAQWLEGAIGYSPTQDVPDPETAPLVDVLAAANRAGYVTHFSQPGRPLADGGGQRAAVSGFCDEQLVDRLAAAVLGTDLVMLASPPGCDSPIRIPVTLDVGEAFTWIGATLDSVNLAYVYARPCPGALPVLMDAWQVDVFDPAWGREGLLWERLAAALTAGPQTFTRGPHA